MTTPTTETKEFDPFESASDPAVQTWDLFGKVEISAWACALVKGTGKVPFDPSTHERRFTAIDVFIQPLPEMDVKYPKSLEDHWIAEFAEWAKITLPSIKALGIDNVREINGRWARVARVPSGKQYQKKDQDGNLMTDENSKPVMRDETTFKFVALFTSEDECRAAYLAAGGAPANNGHNVPVQTSENAEMSTAYAFLKVIVTNAARGQTTWADAKAAVAQALTQYPTVAKFYTADSVETSALITETTKLLPF